MNINQLSYHHIKVFLAVYRHRSASVAGCELGLTNSAISRALSNLRAMFDDDLFTRTAAGFVPTERAKGLAETLETVVGGLRSIEKQYLSFIPSESEGCFEIRVYDEFSFAVQGVIDNRILKKAPNLRFNVRILTENCVHGLANGSVDFAVVYEGFDDPSLNFKCFAYTGDIYLLGRKGHPLFGKSDFTARDLARYPLLEIDNYRDLARPLLVDICQEKNCSMKVEVYTESVATAFQKLAASDCVTVVCNQFTRAFADQMPDLAYVVLPEPILRRIKQMRSAVKPIGNYLAFGSTNLPPAFEWVKQELFEGLQQAWIKAAKSLPEKNLNTAAA